MTRVKTFDSTGLATGGRLYAGDLNQIQDQYADLVNLAQALSVGSISIGESGLQLVHYGVGEARLSGALRTDGIVRALGGLYAGGFTTAQRDAIPFGFKPTGVIIFNTTLARMEINKGNDGSPVWEGLDSTISVNTIGARPAASAANQNTFFFASDENGGTLYFSNGSNWTKISRGLTEAISAGMVPNGLITDGMLAGSISPTKVAGTAVTTGDSRMSDPRTPLDASVSLAKIIAGGLSPAAITGTAVTTGDSRMSDPRTPLDGSVTTPKLASALRNVLFLSGSGSSLPLVLKFDSINVSLDPNGYADVIYPVSFPNATLTAVACNGDHNAVPQGHPVVGVLFANHFQVRFYDTEHVYAEGGFPHWVTGSPTVHVNYIAIGY